MDFLLVFYLFGFITKTGINVVFEKYTIQIFQITCKTRFQRGLSLLRYNFLLLSRLVPGPRWADGFNFAPRETNRAKSSRIYFEKVYLHGSARSVCVCFAGNPSTPKNIRGSSYRILLLLPRTRRARYHRYFRLYFRYKVSSTARGLFRIADCVCFLQLPPTERQGARQQCIV